MRYGELYEATKRQLAEPTGSLADAVAQATGYFTAGRMTNPSGTSTYIMRLIGRITLRRRGHALPAQRGSPRICPT